MRSLFDFREHLQGVRQILVWIALVIPVGILSGSASALFLWSLDEMTHIRWQHGWLLFLLPAAGYAVSWIYRRIGSSAEGGNNLILDRIHEPGGGVPVRMAPLVLLGTLLTHLFGGSAGREGTAVQMGGSLASAYGRLCRFGEENMRMLLMAGVAAGFGSVFGTPLTGAIFAMEVLVIGRVQYEALIPALVASLVGDYTCGAWGVHHTVYHIGIADAEELRAALDPILLAKVVVAAMAFGLASKLFAELTHGLQLGFKRIISDGPLRAAAGAAVVIGLVYLVGTRDYLGLGVHGRTPESVSLLSAFTEGGATPWSWWWKLLFTAVTLSVGFKGGEVTPLFFIGATLGNALAGPLGVPVDLFAGLGFVGVFAGATNTPLACTIMGIELFGAHYAVYFAVACFVAYFFSGHSGIYGSQRLGVPKRENGALPPGITLKELSALSAKTGDSVVPDFAGIFSGNENLDTGDGAMKKGQIVASAFGKLRIYLTPRERVSASGFFGWFNAKPVYREIVMAAKREGIANATAHMTHFGFNNGGRVQAEGVDAPDPSQTICVELIDRKDRLEAFCGQCGELLTGKTIVYKPVEQWDVRGQETGSTDA